MNGTQWERIRNFHPPPHRHTLPLSLLIQALLLRWGAAGLVHGSGWGGAGRAGRWACAERVVCVCVCVMHWSATLSCLGACLRTGVILSLRASLHRRVRR